MTAQVRLKYVWGSTGGNTDPNDTKYNLGWVSEIPAFQNFNYVLGVSSTNILHMAESDSFDWQNDINYQVDSKVSLSGKTYHCHVANINQSPLTDTTNSYWRPFEQKGNKSGYSAQAGMVLDSTILHDGDTWKGQETTMLNSTNSFMLFGTTNTNDNWLFGVSGGDVVCKNVGNIVEPDGSSIVAGSGSTFKVYHEGNKPEQADVAGTIPANPVDGVLYGRKDGNWVTVTTTIISDTPPTVTGKGTFWFNLKDGNTYIDIDDGDSSQWVPSQNNIIRMNGATGSFTAQSGEVVTVIDGLITSIV